MTADSDLHLRMIRCEADGLSNYAWEATGRDANIPGLPRDYTYREAMTSTVRRILLVLEQPAHSRAGGQA